MSSAVPPSRVAHAVAKKATDVTTMRTAEDSGIPNSDGKDVCVFRTVMKEKVDVVTLEVEVMVCPAALVVVKTCVWVITLGVDVGIGR